MKRVMLLGMSAALLMASSAWAQPNGDKAKVAKPAGTPKVKGIAHLRILHAIPNAGAADVYLDGKQVANNVVFKTISDYVQIDSGKTAVKLTSAGKTDSLLEGSLTATRDGYYTVAAYGTKEKPLLTTQNDNTGKANETKARVRVFHLAPDAPNVDITTPSTRAKDGTADLFKALAFGKDMAKVVTPGKIVLQVRADGKVIKEVPDVTLEAGKRYAIFAVGKAGGAGAEAFDVLVKSAGP